MLETSFLLLVKLGSSDHNYATKKRNNTCNINITDNASLKRLTSQFDKGSRRLTFDLEIFISLKSGYNNIWDMPFILSSKKYGNYAVILNAYHSERCQLYDAQPHIIFP